MIDIKAELQAIKEQREREYISIIDFLDFFKNGKDVEIRDIALYLLFTLKSFNIEYQTDIFYDEDYVSWIEHNGIVAYRLPPTIDQDIIPYYGNEFFKALNYIRDNFDFIDNSFSLWAGKTPTAKDYLSENFHNVYISRSRIEDLLKIQIPLPFETKLEHIQQKVRHTAMALTNTDEFVKNTDINKSPVGLAERLVFEETLRNQTEQIAEQQAEIDRLKAENEHLRSNQTKAEPNTRTRISAAQRAIFGLLYSKVYQDEAVGFSRNKLTDVINADLAELGHKNGISYNTIDNLIDNNPLNLSFPHKQK